MAKDDRTEKATPKRKKEARRKGQVAKSPDVAGWLVVLVGSMLLPALFSSADSKVKALFAQAMSVVSAPTSAAALGVLEKGLGDVLTIVLPIVGAFAAVGVAANVAQSGLAISFKAAAPKWDHLNPIAGFKRLVSVQSLWTLAKQVAKLGVLVGVAYGAVSTLDRQLMGTRPVDMAPVVAYTGARMLSLVREVAALGLVLGVADYAWQRHRLQKSLKMTKHEVKEENRQSEGDPHLRGEMRKKQYRMSRMRMMAAVAHADVVVVNPTHFAVALRYEPERGAAPVVVAKGVDELAARIREEAAGHKVPIVEDPPLARAVYAACDLDAPIPAELYVAVARLLAFVFTLPPVLRSAGFAHRRPASAMVA